MQMRNYAMTLRLISKAALGAVLIFMQVGSISAQSGSSQDSSQKSFRVVSEETYNRVVDILFPRDDPDRSKTVFELVLRFEPSFHSMSQIVIRKRKDKVEVVEYTSLDGNIYDKLNETLEHGGKEDAVAMAKSIRVRQREISVPSAQVKRWYATFFYSLAVTSKTLRERGEEFDRTGGSETILLDGTTYSLWYKQRLNRMSFSLYDVEVDTPDADNEFKLVQWMNAVRRDVGKTK